jgi:glycosyltransferase involved in cell wall biosynthesis
VLLTAYNAGAYIGQALQSVVDQTFGDWEAVVVDDGSTDDTPARLQRWAEREPRVRVITQHNAGISAAANAGLSACRGALVARLDADDRMLPGRLATQVAFMDSRPDVVCSGTAVRLIDAKGRFLTNLGGPADDAGIQRKLMAGHCSIYHPSCIFRKEAAERVGGYDVDFKLAVDIDLFLRLGEVGPLANLPEALTDYRLHDKSVSEQACARQREFCRLACERAAARRGVSVPFEGGFEWRPGKSRASRSAFACKYGWWAFKSGEAQTARSYGWDAVRATPLRAEPWKLVLSAMLKRPERSSRYESQAPAV